MSRSRELPASPWISTLLLAGACTGPLVPSDTDGAADSSSTQAASDASTSPSVTVSTTSVPPPVTTSEPSSTTVAPTSTTTDTTTTDDTTDNSEVTFIDPTEPTVGDGDCNAFDQDCPPGEKCTFWANDGGGFLNATRCVPIHPDAVGPGESCSVEGQLSGLDDCDGTSFCWNVDPRTGVGTCLPYCIGSEANPLCESEADYCVITSDGIPSLCLPRCNPLQLDSCPADETCVDWGDVFLCAPDASGEGGNLFDPCEFVNACSPGLSCVGGSDLSECDDNGCCTPYCDLQAPACPAPTECVPVYEDGAPPGFDFVGRCLG